MDAIKRVVKTEWAKWRDYFDLYEPTGRFPTSLLVAVALLGAVLIFVGDLFR
jgi:hypothetical protein